MLTTKEKVDLLRERYYGRQDTVAAHWEEKQPDDTIKKGVYRLQVPGKKDPPEYQPLTDSLIARHINGDFPLSFYVLQEDGTIRYAGLDFDCKPGREAEGFTFDHVRQLFPVLKEWGLTYRIARSTTNGFHVLFYFSDFVPANAVVAVMLELMTATGFTAMLRQGVKKSLPEIFPKQASVEPGKVGNSLKVEMIESCFVKERNGFVDEENVWVGKELPQKDMVEAQWRHLATAELITPETIHEIIQRLKIKVRAVTPWRERQAAKAHEPRDFHETEPGYQVPERGSVHSLLEGCAAHRSLRDKCLAGKTLSHQEGMALFHAVMHTKDGVEWFYANVPGWAKTDDDRKQLQYSLDKNYAPHSCIGMQQLGICEQGKVCFQKKPPYDNPKAPVADWPEPSPIRYAYMNLDYLKKLEREALSLEKEADPDVRLAELERLAKRAQEFDETQQKELKRVIRGLKTADGEKLITTRELNHLFNTAGEEATESKKLASLDSDARYQINSNIYEKCIPFGYSTVVYVRGSEKIHTICAVDIRVEEIRTYVDEGVVTEKRYVGTCYGIRQGVEWSEPFEISTSLWEDNAEFKKYFALLLGGEFNVLRQDIDSIRQAAMGHSASIGYKETRYSVMQGWHGAKYLMPSVMVNKDGVFPNENDPVHLSHKEHAAALDFKLLTKDELRVTLQHIHDDLLNCWSRDLTTMALAHTMMPALFKPLGIRQRPTLFLEGTTGCGKTELTQMCQYFYGHFEKLLNLQASAKTVASYQHDFKDCLFVLDDFKGSSPQQIHALKEAMQYGYDGHHGGKLKRDSTYQKAKASSSGLMASGEVFFSAESSVVARSLALDVEKQDTSKTRDKFVRCLKRRDDYCGVTPHFVHWVLNLDLEALKQSLLDLKFTISDMIPGRQNADRVAHNTAVNHLIWQLFAAFMLESGVKSKATLEELIDEHWGYTKKVVFDLANRCEEEQSSVVFMRLLKQLILTEEVSIKGWAGHEIERKQQIGFLSKNGELICFYPDTTFNVVSQTTKHIHFPGATRTIAAQLAKDGVIVGLPPGRNQTQVRHDGVQERVWQIPVKLFDDVEEATKRAPNAVKPNQLTVIRTQVAHDYEEGGIL